MSWFFQDIHSPNWFLIDGNTMHCKELFKGGRRIAFVFYTVRYWAARMKRTRTCGRTHGNEDADMRVARVEPGCQRSEEERPLTMDLWQELIRRGAKEFLVNALGVGGCAWQLLEDKSTEEIAHES